MNPAEIPTAPAAQTTEAPHLDEHLEEVDVPAFEDEVELWTTYGGD